MDRGFGADVYAARGFIDDEELRASAQPFRQRDLLLVATTQASDRRVQRRSLHAKAIEILLGAAAFAILVEQTHPAEAIEHRQRIICAPAHAQHQALALAVLGHESDAA